MPRALQRYASRIFGTVRAARGTEDGTEGGARAAMPGRDVAAEAAFSPWRATTLNTPTLLSISLLAAVIIGWYYVHAYARVQRRPGESVSHSADLADSALPPLPHGQGSEAGRGKSEDSGYAIGDILNPGGDPTETSTATPAAGDRAERVYAKDAKPTGESTAQPPWTRALDGSVFTRTTQVSAESGPARAEAGRPAEIPGESAKSEGTSVDRMLRSEITPPVAATVLPTQRLLLPKGAFLDCTLETAIDSTLPGLTTCVTAFDTFSADGTVVLLERGTKLIGEMRSQVQQGTARVFILWTEARTPKGIVVALASPGTDELGRSGLPGTVDRHFFDRFGAAILMSVIDGAIQTAVNRSQPQGGTVILNPSGAADVATEILRSTLAIPPTVRVPQGERIQVLVARDLDFRSVYKLRTR
jgi:type IV secretion system protein VirB10